MNDQIPHFLQPAAPETRLWVQSLSPLVKQQCHALGARACQMIVDILKRNPGRVMMFDPEPLKLAMDFALVHVRRGLDLPRMLRSSDLDFLQDLVNILRALEGKNADGVPNRVACTFPDDVHLLHATRRNAG